MMQWNDDYTTMQICDKTKKPKYAMMRQEKKNNPAGK